jgi:hypothetical protein
MAIEWYISEARPVSQLEILQAAGPISGRLLPGGIDLSLSRSTAERSANSLGACGFFHGQVYGEGPGFTAVVEIDSQPSADSDGRGADPATSFGSVSARRTRCSTVLGIVIAIAWLSVSDGELSGTGLRKYFSPADVGDLTELFRAPVGASYEAAVMDLSKLLLGSSAVMLYK